MFVLRAFLDIPFNGSVSKRTRSRSQITMLTYNVWLSVEKMQERMEALGEIVQELEPDVISFQEVTLDHLGVLKEQSWFARYHLITPGATKQKSRHFVVILSVYPIDKWFIYPFENSPRERKLVIAETKDAVSSSVKFVIAGTHLVYVYNGKNTVLRELQLNDGRGNLPNAERQMPNAERRTQNAERRTPNAERRTPNDCLSAVYLVKHVQSGTRLDLSTTMAAERILISSRYKVLVRLHKRGM